MIKAKLYFDPDNPVLLAEKDFQDENGNWEGLIDSISNLSRSFGEKKSFEVSGLSLTCRDHNRKFRDILSGPNRFFARKKVEIFNDDTPLYTGVMQKCGVRGEYFHVEINDLLVGLKNVILKEIKKSEYDNAPTSASGKPINIIIGEVYGPGGAIPVYRIDTAKFLIADHNIYSIDNVYDQNGTELTGFTLTNENGRAYLNITSDEETLYINCRGLIDAQNQLITDPIEVFKFILDNYTQIEYSDLSEIQTEMQARFYRFDGAIVKKIMVENFLENFCICFDCDFFFTKAKLLALSMFKWVNQTEDLFLQESQIDDIEIDENPDPIRNRIQYNHHYHFHKDYYQKQPEHSRESSIQNWGEFFDNLNFIYIADHSTAYDVVQNHAIVHSDRERITTVSLPLKYIKSAVDIGSTVGFSHSKAVAKGFRKYQIRRLSVDFKFKYIVLTLRDLSSLSGGVIVLGDENELPGTWNEADDYARQYFYVADEATGFFGNGIDPGKRLF
jgi:hypothetical protein